LGLRKTEVISTEQWAGLDHVCYFVLFPVIIFKEIAAADFDGVPVLQMASAMAISVIAMIGLLVVFSRPLMDGLGITGSQFTSLVQGSARWHTFIAFAIIPLVFGTQALSLGAVSAAAMTPLLNILCVIVMARYAHETDLAPGKLLLSILKNPFVFSSLGGVAWQLSGLELPAMALQVLDMIGRGALGLALLTVGAGLRIGSVVEQWPPVALAVVLKLLAMPALMAATLWLMGVSGEAFAVARGGADRLRGLCAGPQDGGRCPHGGQHADRASDRGGCHDPPHSLAGRGWPLRPVQSPEMRLAARRDNAYTPGFNDTRCTPAAPQAPAPAGHRRYLLP
jgi:predicted permease